MMHDWSKSTIETLKLSTGEWIHVSELNFNLQEFGVEELDFIGWHKALSWSNEASDSTTTTIVYCRQFENM